MRSEKLDNSESNSTPQFIESQVSLSTQKQNKIDQYQYNKKKVLNTFSAIFLLILLIVLERISYGITIEIEDKVLIYLQENLGLIEGTGDNKHYINNAFFKIATQFNNSAIFLTFFTNLFITIYVGIDALIALKIMYTTFTLLLLSILFQLWYADPRPFWQNDDIFAPYCLKGYSSPSSCITCMAYFLYYSIHCYTVKTHARSVQVHSSRSKQKVIILRIVATFILFIYSALLFITGEQYIDNIILSIYYVCLFYMMIVQFETQISNLIKHATIMNIDSKRHVFYWAFAIVLFELIIWIVTVSQKELLDIEWVENFMNCLAGTNYDAENIPIDKLMGPQFSFVKSSVFGAFIGALFGVSHCFRHIKTLEWYRGSVLKRFQRFKFEKFINKTRIIVANLFTIPIWIYAIFLQKITLYSEVNQIGISEYLLESILFFLLYFFLFGQLPLIVFSKLKLNSPGSSAYVIADDDDEIDEK